MTPPRPVYGSDAEIVAEVAGKLRSAPRISLFLDYDGTLTRIRRTPGEAVLSDRARSILTELATKTGIPVAIVTGRSARQISALIHIPGIDIAANHGFHIIRGMRSWTHPAARKALPELRRIRHLLERRLDGIPNIVVEDKTYGISVHLRPIPQTVVPRVRGIMERTLDHAGRGLIVTRGKKVLEIRPAAAWSKGAAVQWMLARPPRVGSIPVYIGDDRTDEDAFERLCDAGLSIRVGRSGVTKAGYTISGVSGVLSFLEDLAALRRNRDAEERGTQRRTSHGKPRRLP